MSPAITVKSFLTLHWEYLLRIISRMINARAGKKVAAFALRRELAAR